MFAVDDMDEELFGFLKLCTLGSDSIKVLLNHVDPAGLAAVQDLLDLRQTHPDGLACSQDPKSIEMIFVVLTLARRRATRNDNADLVPMPQHMHFDTEQPRHFTDSHSCEYSLVDLRST